MIKYLDETLMQQMCHELAVALFDKYNEPIPPFELHDRNKLQAILANPRQTFNQQELYPTLPAKAAILYYSLIKGHPFENGNKRIATSSLLVFLHINKKWLNCSKNELENKAIKVASSKAVEKDKILKGLYSWVQDKLIER